MKSALNEWRDAYILDNYEGMNCKELARDVGLSEAALWQRMYRLGVRFKKDHVAPKPLSKRIIKTGTIEVKGNVTTHTMG